MAASSDNVSAGTPMGANLIAGGATFRVWAPRAHSVHVTGNLGGRDDWQPGESNLLHRDQRGYWAGFVAGARDGDQYKFWVKGDGTQGYKRDPYAVELTHDPAYPHCNCVLRDGSAYPWHDAHHVPPPFEDLIIYQLHAGTFAGPDRANRVGRFLDVLERLDHLLALGVTAVELLPVVEFSSPRSLGFEGSDLFSPEMDYELTGDEIAPYLTRVNGLLARCGQPELSAWQLSVPVNQLKVLVDVLHLHGIAVILELVHNHAGFQAGGQDESIYFLDRAAGVNPNDSQFFTDQTHIGPVYAFWKQEVRQFLIDNAVYFLREFHVDGFRHDRLDVIIGQNGPAGLTYAQDMTASTRHQAPAAIQIGEHWPADPWLVRSPGEGGAGLDAVWHDALRDALRAALDAASHGRDATVNLDWVAEALDPVGRRGFPDSWRVVTSVENHDQVYRDKGPRARLPTLAAGEAARTWYGASRARVASALLLTAPGIPLVFMGQEFLEDQAWGDNPATDPLIRWDWLDGGDRPMGDHLRFFQEVVRLRRSHAALRNGRIRVFHVNLPDRIIAFHRWVEGRGQDVVVVASLREETFFDYRLGLPRGGEWREAFNSDIYQNWVNPVAAGNGGSVHASGGGLHGFDFSVSIVIPANAVVVLSTD